jgi:large subunit ribosomal protein L18
VRYASFVQGLSGLEIVSAVQRHISMGHQLIEQCRIGAFRDDLHIYAWVISGDGGRVLATASTAEAEVRTALGGSGKGGNVAAAQLVGKRLAEKAKAAGVEKVAFDRSGFAYHGRVKAVAEAAREAGLQF